MFCIALRCDLLRRCTPLNLKNLCFIEGKHYVFQRTHFLSQTAFKHTQDGTTVRLPTSTTHKTPTTTAPVTAISLHVERAMEEANALSLQAHVANPATPCLGAPSIPSRASKDPAASSTVLASSSKITITCSSAFQSTSLTIETVTLRQ